MMKSDNTANGSLGSVACSTSHVANKLEQADFLAQDCMALEQQMLEREEPAMPWVQARKVVMENRRWYTSKVYRAVYGDDPTLNVATQVNVSVPPDKLASIRERLEAARTLVPPRDEGTLPDAGEGTVDPQSPALE
jgi:hypothetical protein